MGADLERQAPPAPAQSPVAQQVAAHPSFLMVGTIEPRKGHLQALEAFEQLWAEGEDVNLVIVGREGWKPLAGRRPPHPAPQMERLRDSPELGRRLLWLHGIDDDTLQQVYEASTCLLFPSEGEGFGLPLIEAATTACRCWCATCRCSAKWLGEMCASCAYYFQAGAAWMARQLAGAYGRKMKSTTACSTRPAGCISAPARNCTGAT
jgi:glycosyltransferase involved in cell wall biosynthesis